MNNQEEAFPYRCSSSLVARSSVPDPWVPGLLVLARALRASVRFVVWSSGPDPWVPGLSARSRTLRSSVLACVAWGRDGWGGSNHPPIAVGLVIRPFGCVLRLACWRLSMGVVITDAMHRCQSRKRNCREGPTIRSQVPSMVSGHLKAWSVTLRPGPWNLKALGPRETACPEPFRCFRPLCDPCSARALRPWSPGLPLKGALVFPVVLIPRGPWPEWPQAQGAEGSGVTLYLCPGLLPLLGPRPVPLALHRPSFAPGGRGLTGRELEEPKALGRRCTCTLDFFSRG